MKKVCDVYVTKDYDMFSFLVGNRIVDQSNVAAIMESMKEEQLVIPVIVNEKYQIIDGQHKFLASQSLGLPVYFMIQEGYGIEQVLRCNVDGSKKWTNEDFLTQHCELGNEDYIQFKELSQLYTVSVSDLIKLFCQITGEKASIFKQNFKNGKFVMDNKAEALKFLKALSEFNIESFNKHCKKSSFISAFMKLYFRPDYDQENMSAKIQLVPGKLKPCASSVEYLSMLCNNVYSYGCRKNAINFSAETGNFFDGTKRR